MVPAGLCAEERGLYEKETVLDVTVYVGRLKDIDWNRAMNDPTSRPHPHGRLLRNGFGRLSQPKPPSSSPDSLITGLLILRLAVHLFR